MTVLITGGAGSIGMALRERLGASGHRLRLLDVADQLAPAPGETVEVVHASVTDPAAMAAACEGVSAVVHLAGIPGERPWPQIGALNLDGTQVALEAARQAGVTRFVFASSNHAVGFRERSQAPSGGMPDDVAPAPDTFYGAAKVAGEALGRLYHERFGMDVICLRIGSCFSQPRDLRALSTWLSFDDCARLVAASLATPSPGFKLVWGVSANTRRWWSTAGGDSIGYQPKDDAERWAAELTAKFGEPDLTEPAHRYVGGAFTQGTLGG